MKRYNIFNSLGSNYSWRDACIALRGFFSPEKSSLDQLATLLKQAFPGYSVVPTYKGRDALELSLRTLGVGVGDLVLTQAFSCYAVEEAIIRCGAKPLYYDIDRAALVPTTATLDQALHRYEAVNSNGIKVAAIIAQYSLGNTTAATAIERWAQRHHIAYVADLAQAIGAKQNETLLGNGADAIVLSTGRDKVWDGMSGGFALTRQPLVDSLLPTNEVELVQTVRDSLYPIVTIVIRQLYPLYIGKILHLLVNKFGLFYSPIEAIYRRTTQMPQSLATFLLHRWPTIESDLLHRKVIAKVYYQLLREHSLIDEKGIEDGTNLRFPVYVENPQIIISKLEKYGIFISDRWYRKPVDSGSFPYKSSYDPGSCPNAEIIANHCINLPTHQLISPKVAKQIAELVL
ncbi:DegT/DnrJ/EryC1/StrS family aminotransferase [Candidatus Woesebacteria bacterium]|nr:DegT/DnrJ/EryC1/StrS family aminotransferase [Candidatus Woesebacteria bacterium]